MGLIIIIVVLLLVFGGGFGVYRGGYAGGFGGGNILSGSPDHHYPLRLIWRRILLPSWVVTL